MLLCKFCFPAGGLAVFLQHLEDASGQGSPAIADQ